MTQEEIKKILPHRDNMLLVDEAELCEDEKDEQGQPRSFKINSIF